MRVLVLDARTAIVAGRHGRFLVNRHDRFVGRALEVYGEYGELEAAFLHRLIAQGDTVVEAGANIGSHTVGLARQVGSSGTVYAIEPQGEVFALLASQVALNALPNVRLIQAGAGRVSGKLVVPPVDYGATGNFGGVALVPASEAGVPVPIVTVDEILDGRKAHLLKIDVEGMEGEVVAGAEYTIITHKPRIYAENDRVEKSPALVAALLGHGYRVFWHTPRLFNPRNHFGVADNIYGNISSFNLLCIHRDDPARVEGMTEVTSPNDPHPLAASRAAEAARQAARGAP
jgi:FkbM family methyltransferase